MVNRGETMIQNIDTGQILSRLRRRLFFLKMELMAFGLIALFIGLYPILIERSALPDIFSILPVEGAGYRVVVMIVGALAFILGIRTSRN